MWCSSVFPAGFVERLCKVGFLALRSPARMILVSVLRRLSRSFWRRIAAGILYIVPSLNSFPLKVVWIFVFSIETVLTRTRLCVSFLCMLSMTERAILIVVLKSEVLNMLEMISWRI